jgi:hypothetical protein
MKKVTQKVILNTTNDSLNDIVNQLEILPTKKIKKLIDKLALKFSSVLKNELAKQTKKKLKSEKLATKGKKSKKSIPVQ